MDIKIAIASSDGINVDTHFGRITQLRIIELKDGISRENSRIREIVPCSTENNDYQGCHGKDIKFIENIAKQIDDCSYLVLQRIGNFPFKLLKQRGIEPLEYDGRLEEAVRKIASYHANQQEIQNKERRELR